MSKSKTEIKLTLTAASIFLIIICLVVTSLAITYSTVTIAQNSFSTATVSINVNNDAPIINEEEFKFEPGATLKKDFFIMNTGTCSVYYKIYLQNITGDLADIIEIQILDGDEVLYSGTANQLTRYKVLAAEDTLAVGATKNLTMSFYYPPEEGNAGQEDKLYFDLTVDAVQVANNPDKSFE